MAAYSASSSDSESDTVVEYLSAKDAKSSIRGSQGAFSKAINEVLERYYTRGMTGWGQKHLSAINEVAGATGLTPIQVTVSYSLIYTAFLSILHHLICRTGLKGRT